MSLPQATILVVDDQEINRDLLLRRLKRQGHLVELAEDGLQALEMLAQQPFDVVLLDIMMPNLDGYATLERLKADANLRHIPVIMISALTDIDNVARCIELGAEDYLPKPFNAVLLKARIGASLEKKYLRDQEQAFLRLIKQEMETGRRIQADFFPRVLPQPAGWEVAVSFHPAREVSGDFYDVFALPNGRLGFILADVCDKGVGAAMFMALVRTLLRSYSDQHADEGADVLQAIKFTSRYITRHHHQNQTHMFATTFFGVLDTASGQLDYVNAGHHPPIVVNSAGVLQTELDVTGPAVGFMADSQFQTATTHLAPGTALLAYTDGVIEAQNAAGDLFTEEALFQLVATPPESAASLLNRVETAVHTHAAGTPPSDDVTMLALYRKVG